VVDSRPEVDRGLLATRAGESVAAALAAGCSKDRGSRRMDAGGAARCGEDDAVHG
jgi:hypothetical protein